MRSSIATGNATCAYTLSPALADLAKMGSVSAKSTVVPAGTMRGAFGGPFGTGPGTVCDKRGAGPDKNMGTRISHPTAGRLMVVHAPTTAHQHMIDVTPCPEVSEGDCREFDHGSGIINPARRTECPRFTRCGHAPKSAPILSCPWARLFCR